MKASIVYSIFLAILVLIFPNELKAQDNLLQMEDRGRSVAALQEKLIVLEYLHTNATGYYGPLTEAAVRELQQDFQLSKDGVAGPNTFNRLKEIDKLARVVHGEARGEPYKGQVAVAAVIKNRLHSSDFPSSIEGVIFQKNAFTAVHDGQYELTPTPVSYKAVREAWSGWDPSDGATYYYNPQIATSDWIFTNTKPKFSIGRHLFAE